MAVDCGPMVAFGKLIETMPASEIADTHRAVQTDCPNLFDRGVAPVWVELCGFFLAASPVSARALEFVGRRRHRGRVIDRKGPFSPTPT